MIDPFSIMVISGAIGAVAGALASSGEKNKVKRIGKGAVSGLGAASSSAALMNLYNQSQPSSQQFQLPQLPQSSQLLPPNFNNFGGGGFGC